MKWEKLSPNRWRCKYHLSGQFSNRIIVCDIYRRGKKKTCTWKVYIVKLENTLWSGKTQTVAQAKNAIAARILEDKICNGV